MKNDFEQKRSLDVSCYIYTTIVPIKHKSLHIIK